NVDAFELRHLDRFLVAKRRFTLSEDCTNLVELINGRLTDQNEKMRCYWSRQAGAGRSQIYPEFVDIAAFCRSRWMKPIENRNILKIGLTLDKPCQGGSRLGLG